MSLYLCNGTNGQYLILDPESLRLTFSIDALGELTNTGELEDHEAVTLQEYGAVLQKNGLGSINRDQIDDVIVTKITKFFSSSEHRKFHAAYQKYGLFTRFDLKQTDNCFVGKVNQLIETYVRNIRKIAAAWKHSVAGTGLECCRNFVQDCKQFRNLTNLNLSDLGLDLLPFHIGIFEELNNLDLSGNQLRVMPRALLKIKNRVNINLTNNPISYVPDWLTNHHNIIMKLAYIPSECPAQGPIT